jgi:hypothetical protein
MRDFCDFIFDQGLMDFPLAGGSYTCRSLVILPFGPGLIVFLFLLIGKLDFMWPPR